MLSNYLKPADIKNDNTHSNNSYLIWWMVLLTCYKLWLVGAQDFLATSTPHDDYLFINLAKHILSGEWLGPYNQMTLIKGPSYPLFIAAANYLDIPLLLMQQLVYAAACMVTIIAFRPLLEKQWVLFLIFFLLLFNPFTYNYPGTGRAFRFGLSMPLVLALFSTMGGLLLRVNSSFLKKLVWSSAIAVLFTSLWYTREEGIWLLPSLSLFALYFLFLGGRTDPAKYTSHIMLLCILPIVFYGCTTSLQQKNSKYYGSPCINELKSEEFQAALGGLMNINVVEAQRAIPVPLKNQEAAYNASPTFRELKPYFEEGKKGAQLPPSFYIWVFRDNVRKSGHADTLPEALQFYRKIGDEIRSACEEGTIPCLDRKPSIKPVWRAEYFKFVPATFWEIFTQAISFRKFTTAYDEYLKWHTTGHADMVRDFQFVTKERLVPGYKHHILAFPKFYLEMIKEKFKKLVDIGNKYKEVVPLLFPLALLIHLFFIVGSFRRKQLDFCSTYGLILLGGILSLVAVLTYVKITIWPINRPLFSAYPLVLTYISTMAICGIAALKKRGQLESETSTSSGESRNPNVK